MLDTFEPTKSREVFVGRQTELAEINRVLEGTATEWIAHTVGDGGAGKTQLLLHILEHARQRPDVLAPAHLIDFYDTANHTDLGVLEAIAKAVGPQHFESFSRAMEKLRHQLQSNPDPTERQSHFKIAESDFVSDLKNLMDGAQRVLIMFDTCEEMHAAETWFLNSLLPALSLVVNELAEKEKLVLVNTSNGIPLADILLDHRLLIVLAGREPLEFPHELRNRVKTVRMDAFSAADVGEFFRTANQLSNPLDNLQVAALYELTGGRPLYVGLSYDWLFNRLGTIEELTAPPPPPFADKLVSWIMRLTTLEAKTVKLAALAWRRMEVGLLARLLDIGEPEAAELMARMARFCFIKYLPPRDGTARRFQLHDEMRDLVRKHVWNREGELTRRELLRQIIAWYAGRIGDDDLLSGKCMPTDEEQRTLMAEWLFYQLELDTQYGFAVWRRIFPRAIHSMDLTLCELLNSEVGEFNSELHIDQQDEFVFEKAHLAARREDYLSARNNWRSLIRRPDISDRLRARALTRLVQAEGYTGEPEEALDHAKEGERLYFRLLDSTTDERERIVMEEDLAKLYNNWGYVHRAVGEHDEALRQYEQALDHQSADKRDTAFTLNNMGYVYHFKGDPDQAKVYVGEGLSIRKQLNIPYDLGLSYNTLGIIMEQTERVDDAADLYHNAILAFENAESIRGQALANINQGRLLRKVNNFSQSARFLEQACVHLERLGDKAYLLEALNEFGCTYRQWGNDEQGKSDQYWDRAEALLKQSLKISQEIKNVLAQADNLEDLSILYYYRACAARQSGDDEARAHYVEKSHDTATEAEKLAAKHDILYLTAKNQRTLGDLAFDDADFATAFDLYFEASVNMMHMKKKPLTSPIVRQRRYDQILDHLKRKFGELSDSKLKDQIVQQLTDNLARLEKEDRDELSALQKYLDDTKKVSERVRKALRSDSGVGSEGWGQR